MSEPENPTRSARWAQLRFAIVGPLLAAPPEYGQLGTALAELAAKRWRHPISAESIQFSAATLERWFYTARNAPDDPLGALRSQRRADAGQSRQLSAALIEALHSQYRQFRHWSYRYARADAMHSRCYNVLNGISFTLTRCA